MLLAIFYLLLTWALLAISFMGIGRTLTKQPGDSGAFEWLLAFWVGYAVVLAFLQLWNFWLPINAAALLIVIGLGLILAAVPPRPFIQGGGARGKGLFGIFNRLPKPEGPLTPALSPEYKGEGGRARGLSTIILLAIAALWVADRALGPGNADDSGNYHYTVIRWANEYPAIPGLANLSAVFTYNNASLLYAAMLNTGPWAGRGEHATNGLLVIALFAQVLPALLRLARGGSALATDLFDLVLLTPAIMLTLGKDLPSPKTDLPAGILTLVMARTALGVFFETPSLRPRLIGVLGLFAGTLVALKLSAGLIALLLFAIPTVYWIYSDRPRAARRTLSIAALGGVMLAGPWIARNVILNGYPLYPSKFLPLPVAWRVPGPMVDLVRDNVGKQSKAGILFWLHDTLEHNGLHRYARLVNPPFAKDQIPPGFSWVRPWIFSLPVSSLVEILMPAGLCGVGVLLLLHRRRSALSLAPVLGAEGRGAGPRSPLNCSTTESRSTHEEPLTPNPSPLGTGARGTNGASWRWLVIAPVAALAFWFITAPDPRFGWAPAWALAALLISWAYSRRGWMWNRRATRIAVAASVALIVPTLGYRLAVLKVQNQVSPLRQVPFQWPGPDHGFWPHPTVALEPVVNRWGVNVYMPVEKGNAMTWGGPLPSAGWDWPPNNPDLRMRRPGNVAAGFVTDKSGPRIDADER